MQKSWHYHEKLFKIDIDFNYYTFFQRFVVSKMFLCYEDSFDLKYSKNGDTLKYYYNLKQHILCLLWCKALLEVKYLLTMELFPNI